MAIETQIAGDAMASATVMAKSLKTGDPSDGES